MKKNFFYSLSRKILLYILVILISLSLNACALFRSDVEETPTAAKKVVHSAYSQLGKRYRPGGASPKKGFDCSGLIYWAYLTNGYKIPRMTTEQAKYGKKVAKEDAREGDILVFKTSNSPRGLHTAIYTGKNQFIHSPSSGKKVKQDTVSKEYWQKRLVSVRRVIR